MARRKALTVLHVTPFDYARDTRRFTFEIEETGFWLTYENWGAVVDAYDWLDEPRKVSEGFRRFHGLIRQRYLKEAHDGGDS